MPASLLFLWVLIKIQMCSSRGVMPQALTIYWQTSTAYYYRQISWPSNGKSESKCVTVKLMFNGGWMSESVMQQVLRSDLKTLILYNRKKCFQVLDKSFYTCALHCPNTGDNSFWWKENLKLTDPYSSPRSFIPRYRPESTPRMLISPTARLINSRIPTAKKWITFPLLTSN